MADEPELKRRTIHVFDYDPETGEVPTREMHVIDERKPGSMRYSILTIDLEPALRKFQAELERRIRCQSDEPA